VCGDRILFWIRIEDSFRIVLKHGGSISAEHGIGIAKRERLPRVKTPSPSNGCAR
jgi:FAD/FMN-containing dehydrogenase